jgi:hypothetical protein
MVFNGNYTYFTKDDTIYACSAGKPAENVLPFGSRLRHLSQIGWLFAARCFSLFAPATESDKEFQ